MNKFFMRELVKRCMRKILKKDYSYIIFDDVFPCESSPFRYVEFMEYALDNYNTYFATTGISLLALNEKRSLQKVIKDTEMCIPYFKDRIFDVSIDNREESLKKIKTIKNPIAVIVFVQNMINDIYDNLQFLEENNIPFIITLYPGGGLKVDDKVVDARLKRIFSSKCFRKAIVTQDNVKEYLLSKGFCTEKDIKFIFGIVTPESSLKNATKKRIFYTPNKTLNICFSAHKYSPKGEDKGYDLFIAAAKKIIKSKKIKNVKFHVIGGFDENVIDIKDIKDHIVFHGIKSTNELDTLYSIMDIIVSPTRPFILSKGSFDGFPTGSTTYAMLNGVVAIVTDELNLNNNRFINNEEIIIVKPDINEIVNSIYDLYKNVDKFNKIAKNGRNKAKKIYSLKYQIDSRLKLINEVAKKEYK